MRIIIIIVHRHDDYRPCAVVFARPVAQMTLCACIASRTSALNGGAHAHWRCARLLTWNGRRKSCCCKGGLCPQTMLIIHSGGVNRELLSLNVAVQDQFRDRINLAGLTVYMHWRCAHSPHGHSPLFISEAQSYRIRSVPWQGCAGS